MHVPLWLPSLSSHCIFVPSRSPQAPALVRHETRSAAALPGHDPTASKPPAQRREPLPLLSRSTPLFVAPSTARTCRESQVWAVANPGPPWNPNFGTPLQPLQNPNFGTLLQPLRNPNFGKMLLPLWNPSFGTLLPPLWNPSFGMLLQPLRNPNFGTLLPPLWNPSFGMLLPPLRNPNFGTLLQPLQNPSFGTLLQPLRNPSFGTLLQPQFSCLESINFCWSDL